MTLRDEERNKNIIQLVDAPSPLPSLNKITAPE